MSLLNRKREMAFMIILGIAFPVPFVHGSEGAHFNDTYWDAVSLPHRRVTLSSTLDENIRRLLVEEGDEVKEGEVLVQLDSREIDAQIEVAAVQADYEGRLASAREEYELAKREYERSASLEGGISASELDRDRTRMRMAELELQERMRSAELASRQLALYKSRAAAYRISAPMDGVVSRIWIDEGEMATAGRQLVEMVDLSRIEIRAHLSEAYVVDVYRGQPVEIRFRSGEREVISGDVVFVSPYVDSGSGTFLVRARADSGGAFLPGMACEIRFLPGE